MNQPIKNEYISYVVVTDGINKPFMLPNSKHPGFKKLFRAWVIKDYFKLDTTKFYTVKAKYERKHGVYGSYYVRIFNRYRINPLKLLYNQLKKSRYNPNFIVVNPSALGKIQFLGENGKLLPLATDEIYPTSQEMGERMEKLKEQS